MDFLYKFKQYSWQIIGDYHADAEKLPQAVAIFIKILEPLGKYDFDYGSRCRLGAGQSGQWLPRDFDQKI